MLQSKDAEHDSKVKMQCVEDIHSLAKALGGSKFQARIDDFVSKMNEGEGKNKWVTAMRLSRLWCKSQIIIWNRMQAHARNRVKPYVKTMFLDVLCDSDASS